VLAELSEGEGLGTGEEFCEATMSLDDIEGDIADKEERVDSGERSGRREQSSSWST